jgi:hypothetical protein
MKQGTNKRKQQQPSEAQQMQYMRVRLAFYTSKQKPDHKKQ